MKAFKFALFLILFSSFCYSQTPNDCVNAITICGNGTFTSNATGIGSIQEVAGCSGFEHNSIWIKINIINGGTLGFNLTPINTDLSVDYDFWVYGANKPCNNLGSPIRCCTTNPLLANLSSNVTGMIGTTVTTTSGPGANGNGFVRWLTVSPGEFYYIAIDRPEGDGGFQLEWTGTAMTSGGAFPSSPTANSLGEVRSCSITPNVGIFDFNNVKSQINPDVINNTFSFYTTQSNAIDGISPLPTIYGNTSNPQTIYARVKNNVTGCFSITSFQLKVYEVPTASVSTTTPIICGNQNGVITVNGTPNAIIEYNINNGATQTVSLDNSGVFQLSSPILQTTIFNLTKVKIVDTSNVTLCTQNLTNFVIITVTPDNTVTAANLSPSICIQTVLPTVTHTTTGATGIGTPTGLPTGVIATWLSNTITIAGTPTDTGIFNYSIPLTGGCGSVNATGTITINEPIAVTAASTNPSTCINTVMSTITHTTTGVTELGTASGLPTGVSASWAGNTITISGTPTDSGIFNYTIPLTGSCGSINAVGTITVTLGNTVSAGSVSPILCVNLLLPSITHTTTGASGIGAATNLPLGVTAVWASNTIIISGSPTNSGVFNYSIPLTGGCGGVATGMITVTPDNTVTAATLSPSICVQTVLPTLSHTTTGATGIGTPSGLPTGVSAVWLSNILTISGTPTEPGIFNYSIPLSGGCGSVNATGTITVNANNTVTAAAATPSICINTLMPSITHSTTGATGIGVATGLPTGVNALWAGNTITIIGTPTASGIFNYTIPLTGGCETINAIGTITVLPNKMVSSASISPVLCVNTVMPDITHTTTEVTGIGTAIGLPTGVNASWTANTITISGTPSTMGVYNYIIPLIGSCGSVNAIGTITVNPTPTNISISGSASTCAGFPVNLTLTATPGTQISWSGSPNPILIHSSGSNVIPVSPSVTTTYEIFSANLNGCSIPVVGQSALVTVASTPQFVTQIPDIEICNGGIMSIASQLTSTVPNTNFIWSATGINVNLAANSGSQTNIDQIVNLINTSQNGSISLVITPRIGNCDGVSQQINIIVKAIPVLTSAIANKNILCNNEMVTITLNSNLSATIYNWQVNTANGVQIVGGTTNGTSTTGILHLQLLLTDPLVAGTLSFNFTPINGTCSGTTFVNAVTLAVNPIPGVPVGTIIDRCSGTPANLSISTSPAIANTTLIWTVVEFQNVTGFANGSALSPYVINDVLVNNSEVQGYVKYRVTSQLGNCNGGTEEFIVRVNPLPKIYMNDGYVCVNQSTGVTYQGYVLDAGIYNSNLSYEWFKLNETTNIFESLAITAGSTYGITQPGAYQVVVTNTLTNCSQSDSVTVIPVFPATGVSTVVTDAFAENATITVSLNATGTGNLMYSLDGGPWQTSPVFEGVDSGSHEIKIIDSEGCTDLTTEVFVIDYPKYFTPNGDGYHDTWFIEGIDQWEATLSIYDRFGKLISQFTPGSDNQGWDGTYLGLVLPSTDYWFTIKYKENDQQKLFRAHFALKR